MSSPHSQKIVSACPFPSSNVHSFKPFEDLRSISSQNQEPAHEQTLFNTLHENQQKCVETIARSPRLRHVKTTPSTKPVASPKRNGPRHGPYGPNKRPEGQKPLLTRPWMWNVEFICASLTKMKNSKYHEDHFCTLLCKCRSGTETYSLNHVEVNSISCYLHNTNIYLSGSPPPPPPKKKKKN